MKSFKKQVRVINGYLTVAELIIKTTKDLINHPKFEKAIGLAEEVGHEIGVLRAPDFMKALEEIKLAKEDMEETKEEDTTH